MTSIQRILVATDLSGPSRHAVDRAARLAAQAPARLDVLHVVSRGALDHLQRLMGADALQVEQQILSEAQSAMSRQLDDLEAIRGLSPDTRVAAGIVVDEIVTQAEASAADLLVLGARGAGFLRHLLLGTTAERLLRRTTRPVLVVKQVPRDSYRRAIVAVDFSASSARALGLVRSLAPAAAITLVHAFEVPFEDKLRFADVDDASIRRYRGEAEREARAGLEAFAAAAGMQGGDVRLAPSHGEASRVLLEREQEEDADLLVVGKRGKGLVEELLLGSVTRHLLAESSADLLIAGPGSHPEGLPL